MAFRHGVYTQESPTPLTPPIEVDSALPVAVGVAPVHRLANPALAVNVPMLLYSYAKGEEKLGYSDNWSAFNLSEVLYSQFKVHNVSPLVLINVWDPSVGAEDVTLVDTPLINGVATIDDSMAMVSTVVIPKPDSGNYAPGIDYTLKYEGEHLVITMLTGALTSISVTYKKAKVSGVTAADIIGGISVVQIFDGGDVDANPDQTIDGGNASSTYDETIDGNSTAYRIGRVRTGIELVDEVYLRFQRNAGFLLAPGWSDRPTVAEALTAKAQSLNGGNFSCIALLDLPADNEHTDYAELPAWKTNNGYTSPYTFADWPCVGIGNKVFHASTRLAGLYGEVDAANGGYPYVSASNKELSMTKICLASGTELSMLDQIQANYLNASGIGTFLNWGGWRAWGNETAAYPGNGDVKDTERSIRRMFCWIQNTVNRTIWKSLDSPISRALIDSVLLALNQWFNTLTAEGAILGGRVEFLASDNNQESLQNGRLFFRVYICPPGAAKDITFDFQYDPSYLDALVA